MNNIEKQDYDQQEFGFAMFTQNNNLHSFFYIIGTAQISIKLMSLLLSQITQSEQQKKNSQSDKPESKDFIKKINSVLKSILSQHNIKICTQNSSSYQIKLLIYCFEILPTCSAILSISLNLKTAFITAQTYFITNNNEQILTIPTKSLKIFCIKAIFKHPVFAQKGQFYINIKSGQLKCRLSTFRINYIEESMMLKQIIVMVKQYIKSVYNLRQKIAMILFLININTCQKQDSVRCGYLKSLWKLLGLFNVTPTFELTEGSAGFNMLLKQYEKQKKQINEIMRKIEKHFLSIFCLPLTTITTYKKLIINDLRLTIQQRKRLRQMVVMPVVGCTVKTDNKYITNEIQVTKPIQNTLKISNTGSFGDLSIAKITFNIVNQQDKATDQSRDNNYNTKMTKVIVWKKSNGNHRSLERIRHQVQIIKKMKNASSIFLPKYYITNQRGFQDSVLLDFYMGLTLFNYVKVNKTTISLWTKIYFVYNIAQGLRYLKRYNIVHMDIKPTNLLVTKWLIVKIIDFGQSYHPEVCSDTYRPGFTYPYVSPQVFSNNTFRTFNEKQDVYALGIILYELLFDHYPFKVSRQRFQQACLKRQLNLITEIMPQQAVSFGEQSIILILMQVIMRCLNQNPQSRPYIDWIALVLRECISYYRDC